MYTHLTFKPRAHDLWHSFRSALQSRRRTLETDKSTIFEVLVLFLLILKRSSTRRNRYNVVADALVPKADDTELCSADHRHRIDIPDLSHKRRGVCTSPIGQREASVCDELLRHLSASEHR